MVLMHSWGRPSLPGEAFITQCCAYDCACSALVRGCVLSVPIYTLLSSFSRNYVKVGTATLWRILYSLDPYQPLDTQGR